MVNLEEEDDVDGTKLSSGSVYDIEVHEVEEGAKP